MDFHTLQSPKIELIPGQGQAVQQYQACSKKQKKPSENRQAACHSQHQNTYKYSESHQ